MVAGNEITVFPVCCHIARSQEEMRIGLAAYNLHRYGRGQSYLPWSRDKHFVGILRRVVARGIARHGELVATVGKVESVGIDGVGSCNRPCRLYENSVGMLAIYNGADGERLCRLHLKIDILISTYYERTLR